MIVQKVFLACNFFLCEIYFYSNYLPM
ncbi:hypothetical protein ACJIZ3_000706 [Penstemon smallii]|uniref:Uncharacterized protein n=1 Tax=Penstemon smallii TaxID=265156 RepID=A0ABD3RBE7_9LAMI